MPQEIQHPGFSRLSLASNVFDEEPPPLPGGMACGEASADDGMAPVTMRPREGRNPGRATASHSPSRSRSASAADSAPLPVHIRQGTARAALSAGAEAGEMVMPSVIIDETLYRGSFASALDLRGREHRAMRLDEHIPWSAELVHVKDDGYAKLGPRWTRAPGEFGELTRGGSMQTSTARLSGLTGVSRSRPHPRPHSIGGRSLFGESLLGAATAGTLPSTGRATPVRSPSDRVYVQTVIFADPNTLSPASDTPSPAGRTMARAWQRIADMPRALVSVCREWAQRFFDWLSALR